MAPFLISHTYIKKSSVLFVFEINTFKFDSICHHFTKNEIKQLNSEILKISYNQDLKF